MPRLSLLEAGSGQDMFEVFLDGRSVGLVWKEQSVWYADPKNTANPLITAGVRHEAVEGLLEEQGLELPDAE